MRPPDSALIPAILDVGRAMVGRYLAGEAARRGDSQGSAFAVSAAEVADLLRRNAGPEAGLPDAAQLKAAMAQLIEAMSQPGSGLGRLATAFDLRELDVAIVAALLAPELSIDVERAYAFALDDFTRKRPDLGFLARMIAAGDRDLEHAVLDRLGEDRPLRQFALVQVSFAGESTPASMRAVRASDRLVDVARGIDRLDESLQGLVRLGVGGLSLDQVVIADDLKTQIVRALEAQPGARLLLAGRAGTGRGQVVEAWAHAHGRATLRVDLGLIAAEPAHAEARLATIIREAAFRGAAIILDAEDLPTPPSRQLLLGLDIAAQVAIPLVFTLPNRPAWLSERFMDLFELDVPPPDLAARITLWGRFLPAPLTPTDADIELIAGRYGFSAAAIAQVARRAGNRARIRAPEAPLVNLDELTDVSRQMFSHRLGTMAQRIPTGFSWDDLVLPEETLHAVKEVVRFARQRAFLLEQWGFARKLPYGRGVSAIMAGPPGTGKTMVAQLLAKDLGYELFRIDLSQVVNKYIGETEKNLAKIFDEAESAHAVLFFDEADSLFAKRTEVKSSNDRYANLEVNYLLQRMETFDGVTLLATNLEQGIDEAFKRRVRFSVQFELPDVAERRRLWRSMFPPQAPLADNIDWDKLALGFEMSGGYIKKAAVRAAMLAADAVPRRPISTADMLEAARAEYREMGRIVAG